jgi:hypothetical protein
MAGRVKSDEIPSLNPRQLQALKSAGPSADDILANVGALNEEIVEQAEAKGVELANPELEDITIPQQVKGQMEHAIMIDEAPEAAVPAPNNLDAINAELDKKLAEQQARRAAEAQAAIAEAPEPVEEQAEMSIEEQVLELLKKSDGAPSEAQIAAWKAEYGAGGVQVMALGEGDVYVFTYLRRKHFQGIQAATIKQSQIEGMAKDPEEYMTEQVLKACVLWPKLDVKFWYNSRAGVIPTLYNSVMLHSYHLTPQQAMVLTAQL